MNQINNFLKTNKQLSKGTRNYPAPRHHYFLKTLVVGIWKLAETLVMTLSDSRDDTVQLKYFWTQSII